MVTYAANFPNRPFHIRVNVEQVSQNYAANTSQVAWSIDIAKNSYSPTFSTAPSFWSVTVGGQYFEGSFTYDFRNSDFMVVAQGQITMGHDSGGYSVVQIIGAINAAVLGATSAAGPLTLSRIPKAPGSPGAPKVSNLAPTSVTLSWTGASNNNGASIDQYKLRVSKNNPADQTPYTDYDLSASTLSRAVTGLTPGTQYYAVVYARNSQGYSVKSGQVAFKTLSGAYVRRGGQWRPTEVLVRRSGKWVSGEVLVRKGSSWVAAS